MRMGAHGVRQPRSQARPLTAVMLMTVLVTMAVVMAVAVLVVRADRGVHDIQHARINALPHIDNYQRRAIAN
jgi:hypothetical protein